MNPMTSVQHPNKTFVANFIREDDFIGRNKIKTTIIVVADSEETAKEHLYDLFRIRPELIWLMGCNHPTIYDQTGNKPLERQAKVMYRTHAKVKD